MDKVVSDDELVLFIRKANATPFKKDAAGNQLYKAGSGKIFRVIKRNGSNAVQSIPGCGSCSKEQQGAP